ncbi:MAG: M24 family metallopeptidase [Planctomycetota bacterium]
MSSFETDVAACRSRQARLWQAIQNPASLGLAEPVRDVELIVVTQPEHIQWLMGPRFTGLFQPVAALRPNGESLLVVPERWQGENAATTLLPYSAKHLSTLRNDQRQASTAVLLDALARQPAVRRAGVEFSTFGRHFGGPLDVELVDLEPLLYRLRRRKDPDELARQRHAIAATGAMYEAARRILRPGLSEVDMFVELQATAVKFLDEPLTGTGNDFQCASRGGNPRSGRLAAAGELYILDLGPAFRGYFADTCRTLAVTEVSVEQQRAWEAIQPVFDLVERTVRPGVSARQLFQQAQEILDRSPHGVFNHHLGHGIGLFPHEAPHLNPNWDDSFEIGDTFTVEPGLYAPELRAGMRLENNYLVTADGVELLSDFPLELRLS